MGWKENHQAFADARATVHDELKKPVMFSSDSGVSWRVVFCRLHEKINVEGIKMGAGDVTISASTPNGVFLASDVPDISSKGCIVSVAEGKVYKVAKVPSVDRMGYLTVALESVPRNANSTVVYPVPDWDAL